MTLPCFFFCLTGFSTQSQCLYYQSFAGSVSISDSPSKPKLVISNSDLISLFVYINMHLQFEMISSPCVEGCPAQRGWSRSSPALQTRRPGIRGRGALRGPLAVDGHPGLQSQAWDFTGWMVGQESIERNDSGNEEGLWGPCSPGFSR